MHDNPYDVTVSSQPLWLPIADGVLKLVTYDFELQQFDGTVHPFA